VSETLSFGFSEEYFANLGPCLKLIMVA
jgi:hypothetical protein